MTPLYLLRHGPTDASVRGAPLGHLDLPVIAAGQCAWPDLKSHLLGLGIERVLCSDRRRAREHAQDLGVPCLVLQELGEQDFGEWDGIPWSEIRGAESFFARPATCAPPGGESYAHCASRVLLAFHGAWVPTKPTLVLAHGGPLRAIMSHFIGMSVERSLDLAWAPFGLTRLDWIAPDRAVLQFHNCVLSEPHSSVDAHDDVV